MEGTREAEMIVQFGLQGMTYALRLSGTAAKNIAAMIAALAKQPDKSPGATRMKALLQSGEPLDYYTVPADKMQKFAEMSKKYGIQYCVAMNQDGAYDLVVKKSDSSRINRISEMLGIGQVKGSLDQDLSDAEKQTAENLTPEQKILQDMMSPNRDERERDEPNFKRELPEGERVSDSSSININERESVVDQIENYQHAQESARDMFAGARSLREAVMTDLPDGAEPVIANVGWDRPVTRYNEDGEQLFRGKTADQMTDLDKMQYMVDQEMLSNGKLSENFIQQMYVSGYRVDESGMVMEDRSSKELTSKEKLMIADMMREPEKGNMEKTLADAVEAMKGVEKYEHRQ